MKPIKLLLGIALFLGLFLLSFLALNKFVDYSFSNPNFGVIGSGLFVAVVSIGWYLYSEIKKIHKTSKKF